VAAPLLILVAVILLLTSLCYLRIQTLSAWILNSSFHVLTATSITSVLAGGPEAGITVKVSIPSTDRVYTVGQSISQVLFFESASLQRIFCQVAIRSVRTSVRQY